MKAGVVTDAGFYWALIVGITYYCIGLGLATLFQSSLTWAAVFGASCLGAAVGLHEPKPHA